ncbi:hypothetical protein ABQG64_14055, partial [Escherichia coli]
MSAAQRSPASAQRKPSKSAGKVRERKPLRRMSQDPDLVAFPVANFDSELVQDQPSVSLRSHKMLSLYTNLMARLRTEEKG